MITRHLTTDAARAERLQAADDLGVLDEQPASDVVRDAMQSDYWQWADSVDATIPPSEPEHYDGCPCADCVKLREYKPSGHSHGIAF